MNQPVARWLVLLVGAALLAACITSPTATPAAPTVSPTQPPLGITSGPIPRPTRTRAPTWTPTPTPTVTPVPTPAPTSTPIPITPLAVRTWPADPVLVQVGGVSGDMGDPFTSYYNLPTLLLYADGRLIIKPLDLPYRFLQAQLDRRAMCALLNTIDQTGFFDYDPAPYDQNANLIDLHAEGGGTTIIGVHAWRSRYVAHEELWDVYRDNPEPWVHEFFAACRCYSTALRDTYRLLSTYAPEETTPYVPEEVLLLLVDEETAYGTPTPLGPAWPISSISLTQVPRDADGFGSLLLHGEEGRAVYQALGGVLETQLYSEAGRNFYVMARPLLPYESPAGAASSWQIPSPDVPTSTVEMTCYPEDGVLPIP